MWNQSQTKAFIGTLNSHLAGCSTGCLQGCWAAWAAGPAGEEFSAAASSLDLQQRKNEGSDPTEQNNNNKHTSTTSAVMTAAAKQILPSTLVNLHPRVTKWQKHLKCTPVWVKDYVISSMSWLNISLTLQEHRHAWTTSNYICAHRCSRLQFNLLNSCSGWGGGETVACCSGYTLTFPWPHNEGSDSWACSHWGADRAKNWRGASYNVGMTAVTILTNHEPRLSAFLRQKNNHLLRWIKRRVATNVC